MVQQNLLERLEQLINIDVDCVDLDVIASLCVKPHNQTSNQVIMSDAMLDERNHDLFIKTVTEHSVDGWEAIFDRFSVRICKRNLDSIKGRVLVQTSPRYISDQDATLRQCRRFAKFFEEEGIPQNRFAIKLPFTGPNACAASRLQTEGIQTLATSVFTLEQAIAASQARCGFVSPYFNEIAAYTNTSLWPQSTDPALKHPMSPRIIRILATYASLYQETGEYQPTMIIASHFDTSEIFAMTEIGCEHVTISSMNLKALADTADNLAVAKTEGRGHPYANYVTPGRLMVASNMDPLAATDWDGVWASTSTDFLAKNGELLDKAINADGVAALRLKDAMVYFLNAEKIAKDAIEVAIHAM
ncbi:hypothetical protein MBLNU13_g09746t1 [Cladosporium sp. NU13]